MDCPFCDEKNTGSRIIYRDDLVMAFPTNMPIVPGHVLVCPVRHAEKVDELTDEELSAIRSLIIKLKAGLTKSFDAEGFNIAWNDGSAAGQVVNHMHVHVLPRKAGDEGVYGYEPREFLYRPGLRGISPEQELSEIAGIIRNNLTNLTE